RGSLEVEQGDVRLAENFLNQARALEPNDHLVVTEFAYMSLKKAMLSPTSPSASALADESFRSLRELIASRGSKDSYPYHVLGSQALAWSRRAGMGREERKQFLRMVVQDLGAGLKYHPVQAELRELLSDVQKELLSMEVV
ncbi:MAG: hypothetical protein ABW123_05070, partial [Cystobacter sp.]